MDTYKYRKTMTDLVWRGIEPEMSDEDKVAAAKEAMGKPAPQDAMDELAALRARGGVTKSTRKGPREQAPPPKAGPEPPPGGNVPAQ